MKPKSKRAASPASKSSAVASHKTSKTYRLSEAKIAAVREILGAPTATATIETALDMVIFRQELVDGTRAMQGVKLAPYDTQD